MLNVILEASALLHPLTGIGRYTHELARGMAAHPEVNLRYWVQNRIWHDWASVQKLKPQTHFPLWSKPYRVVRNRVRAQWSARDLARSVFHGANFFCPVQAQRAVITVHDLSVLLYPETHPAERRRQFDLNLERSINQAQRIITDSEFVRQEVLTHFGCAPSKVVTVHIGVAPEYQPAQHIDQALLVRYGLRHQAYTLCVATIEPRKNIDQLLSAYEALPENLRKTFPLILVGGYGWLASEIMARIEQGSEQGWVRKLGFVPETDLVGLYQHARLFAYPSAYEGFGLPVLEAMACGIPVVCSNRSSLPEVAGGAAALIDPDDVGALSMALHRGLEDGAWRETSAHKGPAVAAGFSWGRCVTKTLEVYKSVT